MSWENSLYFFSTGEVYENFQKLIHVPISLRVWCDRTADKEQQ